jgi:hypothetical protein
MTYYKKGAPTMTTNNKNINKTKEIQITNNEQTLYTRYLL